LLAMSTVILACCMKSYVAMRAALIST
jgi:hypothetical protein